MGPEARTGRYCALDGRKAAGAEERARERDGT